MRREALRVGDFEEDADCVESAGRSDVCFCTGEIAEGFLGDDAAAADGDVAVWLRLWLRWRLLDRSRFGLGRRDLGKIVLPGLLA